MSQKGKLTILGLLLALLIIVGIVFATTRHTQTKKTEALQNELYDLKNKTELLESQVEANETKLVKSATGLDQERVTKDDRLTQTFLKKILTWSDGTTYNNMRKEIQTTYALDETETFMTTFLPVNVTTPDGKYNYIDTHHSNCNYESMHSYVTAIGLDSYSYFAFVTWSTADLVGNEKESTCVFQYSINTDGKLSQLSAYTLID